MSSGPSLCIPLRTLILAVVFVIVVPCCRRFQTRCSSRRGRWKLRLWRLWFCWDGGHCVWQNLTKMREKKSLTRAGSQTSLATTTAGYLDTMLSVSWFGCQWKFTVILVALGLIYEHVIWSWRIFLTRAAYWKMNSFPYSISRWNLAPSPPSKCLTIRW